MGMLGVSFTINFTVDWEIGLNCRNDKLRRRQQVSSHLWGDELNCWSGGRFLSRLVGELLEGVGIKIPHNEGKPFSISPILDMNGRIVNKLVPGSVYWFRVSFMCNTIDCDTVTSAFIRDSYKLSGGEVIRDLNVGFYEFGPNISGSNSRSIIERSDDY